MHETTLVHIGRLGSGDTSDADCEPRGPAFVCCLERIGGVWVGTHTFVSVRQAARITGAGPMLGAQR